MVNHAIEDLQHGLLVRTINHATEGLQHEITGYPNTTITGVVY